MKLVTTLKKHFDVIEATERVSNGLGGVDVPQLWVFEKGEDGEPLFILKCARALEGREGWIVGNIYSTLQHGQNLSDAEIKALLKRGEIRSK